MSASFTLEAELKELILRMLGTEYTSISSAGGIETGNHYQSVALGDIQTSGFREDRAALLDRLDFPDRRVLDLGSNLGELSRAARARGAYLVDGFEGDPYFLEIAELINVFTGVTRVSFYQRDITDPACYDDEYDMVLAFSVFTYVRRCLPRIAEITDVLVLETHKLSGNFDSDYLLPVSQYFPHYRIVGESDWSAHGEQDEIRAVVVFAKEPADLEAALRRPPAGRPEETAFPAGERKNGLPEGTTRFVDVARTSLQDRFFSNFDFESNEELLTAVDGMKVDPRALAKSADCRARGYEGWVYWFLYLNGYLDYCRTGKLGPGNVYYDYLIEHEAHDVGVSSELSDPHSAAQYVARQFQDMDLFRERNGDASVEEQVKPIRVVVTNRRRQAPLQVFEPDKEAPLLASRVDGWHRLFGARIFDVHRLRCDVMEDTGTVPPIRGVVEQFDLAEDRLLLRGWCLDPKGRIVGVEVCAKDKLIGHAEMVSRPDIRDAFPHIAHAERSGFELDVPFEVNGLDPIRFDLTGLRNFLSVGVMRLEYEPGMLESHEWPPKELSRRYVKIPSAEIFSLTSMRITRELLEPVSRYRTLNSFRSVLDWGCGCGLLEFSVERFLPEASVTAVDGDVEAIEWCRQSGLRGTFGTLPPSPPAGLRADSFDLVLGYSTLGRLTPAAQETWLHELHRIMKSGGYAALSIYGELLRPLLSGDLAGEVESGGVGSGLPQDTGTGLAPPVGHVPTHQTKAYTLRQCLLLFDVVSYLEGAVNSEQDLIVLRKA